MGNHNCDAQAKCKICKAVLKMTTRYYRIEAFDGFDVTG